MASSPDEPAGQSDDAELPEDVIKIIRYLARTATAHDNTVQASQIDKLAADMTHRPDRWAIPRVTVSAVREKCTELGVTADDIGAIVDLLVKAQTGDRLIPDGPHRDFEFSYPIANQ